MADPSPTYGWQLPSAGQESWHVTVASIFQAIDAVVGSLSTVRRLPIGTLVFSFVGQTGIAIFSTGTGAWQQLSCAPFGSFVGSFEMFGNRRAFFDLRAALAINSLGNQSPNPYQDMLLRLVINPGSLALPNATSGMLWRHTSHGNSMQAVHYTGWLMAASLATGKFSVAIQQMTTGSARFVMAGSGGFCQILGWEVSR